MLDDRKIKVLHAIINSYIIGAELLVQELLPKNTIWVLVLQP